MLKSKYSDTDHTVKRSLASRCVWIGYCEVLLVNNRESQKCTAWLIQSLWKMQGRPVGQYIPPSELQSKAKQQKKKSDEATAPESQVIASGRLVSASEAGMAQPHTGGCVLSTCIERVASMCKSPQARFFLFLLAQPVPGFVQSA